jgi:hypothetical protein
LGKLYGFNPSVALSGVTDVENEIRHLKAAGANAQRYTVSWKALQPTASAPPLPDEGGKPPGLLESQGGYLARLDRLYLGLVANGMRPVIALLGAPAWATEYARCDLLDDRCRRAAAASALPPSRANLGHWQRFAAAMAGRYPTAAIEPWNEPNIKPFWHPSDRMPDPAHMASMQCAAYEGIKRLPSPTTVLSPGFAGFATPRADGSPAFEDYLEGIYARGLRRCMDGLSVHLYPANSSNLGAGSALAIQFDTVRRVRARHGDATRIWVTETGSSSFPNTSEHRWGITEAEQADLNRRLYNKLTSMDDVHAVMFHTLRNPVEKYAGRYSDPGMHYGFVREDWTPKPVWCDFVGRAGHSWPGC